jgi:ribosomal protein S18 acetylase RimI-like enzyme
MSAGAPIPEARLRLAGAADLDAVVALTEIAYRPYTELFGAPPIPVTEDYLPRIAAGEVWLLESDDTPAGVIVLETQADHLMVFSVAVSPRFQGRGFGRRLLRWAEECARVAHLQEVRLYTNARMEKNIALYSAFGFAEIGRRPNPVRPGWTLVDMAKRVAMP